MTRCHNAGTAGWRQAFAIVLLVGFASTQLAAQEAVDLELQTERSDAYEEYLETLSTTLQAQLDAGTEVDKARLSLILVKLSRISNEAQRTADRVDDAQVGLDEGLHDLAELIGDDVSEEDPGDLEELLQAIHETFIDDEEFEADAEEIADSIEADGDEIEAAFDDFGDVLQDEADQISDLAEALLDSDEDFSVTVRIEGPGVSTDEVVTITRADLDDLQNAYDEGESAGNDLADAVAGFESAASDWEDAVDLFDLAASTTDNRTAIETTRSGLANLDAALLSLESAFDSSPLEMSLSTGQTRDWIGDVDSLLAGRTFAIGDRTVRPVALLENRSGGEYLDDEMFGAAVVLAMLTQQAMDDASEFDEIVGLTGIASIDIYYERSAQKARTRGWTWLLLAASAVGLSDPADEVLLEFWSADEPAAETLRGFFTAGLSPVMMEVLGVDLVVNVNASREQTDQHMELMRDRFANLAIAGDELADEFGVIVDTVGALQAHAGLAIVRTYFLVADNHQDVLDVVELARDGDIVGIVDRFDTEDFDYSASLDSTQENLDLAREDEELVFLVLDKLDDDGNLFGIEADDSIVPIPLTGEALDLGMDAVGSVAETATMLADLGAEAMQRAEEVLELDLDPNELDFTDAEEPLDFALALEVSNPDFLSLASEGAQDIVDVGDRIEDALVEFAGAMSEMAELMADLEQEQGADLFGMAEMMSDMDEFYQEMRSDFEHNPATTDIAGEPVNLSAWFDRPPEHLLQSFIAYLDDDDQTDNTLAGLLPGESVQSVVTEQLSDVLPATFALRQNYPNPFNSGTVIEFDLTRRQSVNLSLHNLAGQQVIILAAGSREPGSYRLLWDGTDARGQALATGVYLYRLETEEQTLTRQLLLLR